MKGLFILGTILSLLVNSAASFGGPTKTISYRVHSVSLEADWKYVNTTFYIIDKNEYAAGTTAKSYKDVSKDLYLEFYACPKFSFNSNECRLVSSLGTWGLQTNNFETDYIYPNDAETTITIDEDYKVFVLAKEKRLFKWGTSALEDPKFLLLNSGESIKLHFFNKGAVDIVLYRDL